MLWIACTAVRNYQICNCLSAEVVTFQGYRSLQTQASKTINIYPEREKIVCLQVTFNFQRLVWGWTQPTVCHVKKGSYVFRQMDACRALAETDCYNKSADNCDLNWKLNRPSFRWLAERCPKKYWSLSFRDQ